MTVFFFNLKPVINLEVKVEIKLTMHFCHQFVYKYYWFRILKFGISPIKNNMH